MKKSAEDLRILIKNHVYCTVGNFLYFDRLNDAHLSLGSIEEAIENNIITTDDIVKEFSKDLNDKVTSYLSYSKYKVGQEVAGIVSEIASFGIHIMLDGVRGLIYNHDLGSVVLERRQKVVCRVLTVEPNNQKIILELISALEVGPKIEPDTVVGYISGPYCCSTWRYKEYCQLSPDNRLTIELIGKYRYLANELVP